MATLSASDLACFAQDGYVIVRGLYAREEIEALRTIAKADRALAAGANDRLDSGGNASRLALRYELGDDVYSALISGRRMVSGMEQVLGGPVGYFHHKMMMKEAHGGGAWEWHQDYGYWYDREQFLYPDLASCMVAVDPCTIDNGCLQVIRGSHLLGRLDHGPIGEQHGADPARVAQALTVLPLAYATMEPGDALFFHSNTLHRSDANESDYPRWVLIGCFYRQGNPAAQYAKTTTTDAVAAVEDDLLLYTARRELAERATEPATHGL
ncbi:MAG: phytanoyl-CoA dioxygenase family protein [Armatimonadetes bacterium]|nr:phytanoyl-CoA dioxygenase family protein [Armatimonadota bacterium]